MNVTSPDGRTWTVEKSGAVAVLLTSPTGIRWTTHAELARWREPRIGYEGLRPDPKQPGWHVREAA